MEKGTSLANSYRLPQNVVGPVEWPRPVTVEWDRGADALNQRQSSLIPPSACRAERFFGGRLNPPSSHGDERERPTADPGDLTRGQTHRHRGRGGDARDAVEGSHRQPVDDNDIALASPADEGVGQDLRLTVYLYDVTQNEHLSNDADTFLSGSQNLTTTSLENTTTDSTTINTDYVTDDGSDNEPLF